MSPPSLSFAHPGELQCVEAPKRLTTQTVACLRVKHGAGPVMARAAISWHSLGPLLVLDGHVNGKDYQTILEEHPMVQTLYPEVGALCQDDNAPMHTASLVCIEL